MVALISGVINVLPVPKTNVLVLVAYHSIVPAKGVDAESVTDPVPHLEAAVPAGAVTTVATTGTLADTQVVPILDST